MLAIFDSLKAAEDYCAEIDAALGYPRAGDPADEYPRGWTLRWAVPRAHPDGKSWMVKVPPKMDLPAGAKSTVEKLDASWSPAVMP